jgi:serine/threonine protein phosphatase PrpC
MFANYRGVAAEAVAGVVRRLRPQQSSMLDVEFSQLSDRGRVRENNEDYLGHALPSTAEEARTHGWLFALADGVGGQERGEVASRSAVEGLLVGFRSSPAGEVPAALLTRLVQAANARIYELGLATGRGDRTMATTLVACALRYDRAVVAHVGDSRCYLFRSGRASLLTRDHTVAGEHERLGLLSAQEAAEASTRHLLTRSLGNDLFVGVETSEHQVMSGDILLLCSDGLYGSVTSPEMAHIIGHSLDLDSAAERLVTAANRRDGSDNISVQLIRVRGVERIGMYRGRPYRLANS